MTQKSEKIVFFGSGPVAASSLEKLAGDFDIEAVITKPRPPHHKYDFPVLVTTEKLGLKAFTPKNKAELNELFETEEFKSQIGIVIDYGILIGKQVIDYFPLGIINSHFSLLPRWRGADPISFAILSGEKQTGVSLMRIVEALDEGPLLTQRTVPLDEDYTQTTLTIKLVGVSHELLVSTLPKYVSGSIIPYPQSEEYVSYSRKLDKSDGVLDWGKPASQLEREIRAFIEWPRSRTKLNGTDVIITQAHVNEDHNGRPGEIWISGKQLGINTSDGLLIIDRLIPAGKKEMPAEAFLSGYRIN